jgi:hypothetical protein
LSHSPYRLSVEDLLQVLFEWDVILSTRVLLVACGGTALTLLELNASTRDVDFLIPREAEYVQLTNMLKELGYRQGTKGANSWLHPQKRYIFDLYLGSTIFQTDLLDPVDDPARHKVIRVMEHVDLAVLNSLDLIISKMFRGTNIGDDSLILIKRESIPLLELFGRYKETASFSVFEQQCRRNFGYLIDALEKTNHDVVKLKQEYAVWNP